LRRASSCTRRRDADAAWLGQRFEPCRDIDASPKDVAILATIQPWCMPMRNSIRLSGATVRDVALTQTLLAPLSHSRNASTYCPNSISRPSPLVLTIRPIMPLDAGCDQLCPDRPQALQAARLIGADQPRIAHHVAARMAARRRWRPCVGLRKLLNLPYHKALGSRVFVQLRSRLHGRRRHGHKRARLRPDQRFLARPSRRPVKRAVGSGNA